MTAPVKILVTGGNGQLASELKELAVNYTNVSFVFFDRSELSISDHNELEKVFKIHQPQYFINCAAYTAVDKAEEEKETAFAINGTAVGTIAELCQSHNCKLIHISTDYVFNGKATTPLDETETVDPVNAYGESKLMGERLAFEKNPETIVIRTSWVYSFYGKNFVKTMMRLMKEKENINVVSDQVGSPTYAADLARVIMEIITYGNWVPGIYHFSNEGVITWHEFAVAIQQYAHLNCTVHPITTEQYPTTAKRPKRSCISQSSPASFKWL